MTRSPARAQAGTIPSSTGAGAGQAHAQALRDLKISEGQPSLLVLAIIRACAATCARPIGMLLSEAQRLFEAA